MLGYERNDYLTLDPDTLALVEPWKAREKLAELNKNANDRFQSERRDYLQRRFTVALKWLAQRKTVTERLSDLIRSGNYSRDDLIRIANGEF
ncbi:hypothetical protein ACLKMY_39035, partial [Paraburkholderia mimosarum]